ncbi:MAG: hypothetical protein Phyf2KO_00590 [Phycisphaerales bacterium]
MTTTQAPPATTLLTLRQVAKRCEVGLTTVANWRRCGVAGRRLPVVRAGKYVRVRERDLDAFLASL